MNVEPNFDNRSFSAEPEYCPYCGAERDPFDVILMRERVRFDCGCYLVKTYAWEERTACEFANEGVSTPYLKSVLIALWEGAGEVKDVIDNLKALGWTGKAVSADNVRLALRRLSGKGMGIVDDLRDMPLAAGERAGNDDEN